MSHTLQIRPADAGRIRMVQVTDTHIARDPGPTEFEGVDTGATLSVVLNAVEALPDRPDCMVLTGDLVDIPSPEAYGRILSWIVNRNYPVVCLAGNHDDPAMMSRLMNSGAVSTSRRIEIAGWRVLMLNDWLAGSDGGRFSAAELEFLDSELAAAGPAPVLICLHHQPVPIGSPWMDAMGLDNGPEFLDIIDSYNNVCGVIWGHIHQEFNSERNGVPLLGTPSTCVQFKPGTDAYTVDPAAPGFRVLELLPGGKLDTRIIRCR